MRLDPSPRAAPVILAVGRFHRAPRCAGHMAAGKWSMDSSQGLAGAESHRARLDTDPERRAPGKALAVGRYLARRQARSEERRVGKEWRSWGAPEPEKKTEG